MQAHLEQEPAPCGPVNFTLFLYNTILETICFCLLLGLTKGMGGSLEPLSLGALER